MPINLFTTLSTAYRFLWQNPRDLFLYAFLPVLIVAFVQIAGLWATGDWMLYFEPPARPEPGTTPDPVVLSEIAPADAVAWITNTVASFVAYVMFAVAWFRRYLVGPEGTTVGAAMRWGPRHWRFVARFFTLVGIILLLALLFNIPLNLITTANPMVEIFVRAGVVVAMLLIASRLFLVLPATAIDETVGFRDAATLTTGRSWYMLGIYLFSLIPALFALVIVARVFSGVIAPAVGSSLTLLFITILVQQSIMFVAIASQVTALAVAYRALGAGAQPPASV